MKIAVINETSAADKNKDIIAALDLFDHKIFNVGMKKTGEYPELTYIDTGFLGALLLNTKKVDFVIGGCGTGQGFLNSVMQYPGVFCGHISSPVDAWLFTQINGGNCISLALNQGYGWAGDVNLKFIFEKLFSVDSGSGYPQHRKKSQQQSRQILADISRKVHLPFEILVEKIDSNIVKNVLKFPGVWDLLQVENIENDILRDILLKRREK
ncbi:MAG: ribose-5-phosphate isomerase [Candidatus Infernicultor aquiphilus]|uniref:Ribose-5-phosphate isomerase n=1 Tax=Candidatus Infernicultor aquiphilus TaxID=1805029 RepID=A0A2M7PMF2_9BACT|nr:MAG: ribose-5-phosphate isomerase [Candidatus Atribacteria bacterium CG17_big_fil_post_rev_8_21_14_2_50_34_11]PIY31705.1 MAG: ribose-5-phosphate isomerase [Candidatus Atribacteria bacterium CG_4_10_14_3_um_filter_34_13]